MLDAIQREVNEELKLDIPQTQFEYIGTVVGQAYPQKICRRSSMVIV